MKKPIQTKKERRMANFFKALGNEWRLLIVELLAEEPLSVSDLCARLNKTSNFISAHLQRLNLTGVLKYETVGKFHRYSINKEKVREILDSAKIDLFRTDER